MGFNQLAQQLMTSPQTVKSGSPIRDPTRDPSSGVDFLHPAGTALAVRASNHNAPIDKFAPIPTLEIVYNPEVLYLQL